MRQVIALDPETLSDKLTAILALSEPKDGEFVKVTDAKLQANYAAGKVVNVRANQNWPATWLYDVVLQ